MLNIIAEPSPRIVHRQGPRTVTSCALNLENVTGTVSQSRGSLHPTAYSAV